MHIYAIFTLLKMFFTLFLLFSVQLQVTYIYPYGANVKSRTNKPASSLINFDIDGQR